MRAKPTLLLLAVPVIAWVLLGFLGDAASSRVAAGFGPRIVTAADGKVLNAKIFIRGRAQDSVVLVTAACVLALAYRKLAVAASRRLRAPACWIVQGWSAFICLNGFVAIAAHTLLFWCLLYTGKENIQNYTQWRIKRGLMTEVEAPSQAVLLGASQTWAQIDPRVLNQRLGGRVWTTDLCFPGSSLYEMALCLDRLPRVQVDYVITYLSEANFYGASDNGRLPYFFGLQDLAAYWTLGPGKPVCDQYFLSGVLGSIFPLYRAWDPLAARLRGWQVEAQADFERENDLAARARRLVQFYGFGPVCDFNKRAFAAFAKRCRERGCRWVVCCGQLNPVAGRALNPAMRPDMLAFLRDQARADSNLLLLEEPQLPRQDESDYRDLTHANPAARARFSECMAKVLDHLTCTNTPTSH